jgi:hypothetical protein
VSKRHNVSRRRTYGRRLHEVHERHDRRLDRDRSETDPASMFDDAPMDPLAFLDGRAPRSRYGFVD